MTEREKILAHVPGRELDALTPHIMGWQHLGNLANYLPSMGIVWAFGANWSTQCPDPDKLYRISEETTSEWNPSSKIHAAWALFLHCCEWPMPDNIRFIRELENQAKADDYRPLGLHALVHLRHKFPEAVCKASV